MKDLCQRMMDSYVQNVMETSTEVSKLLSGERSVMTLSDLF